MLRLQQIILLLVITAITVLPSEVRHAELSREWTEPKDDSLSQPTHDLIASVPEPNDLAATILKIFGFGTKPTFAEVHFTRTTSEAPEIPRSGVKVSDRDVCAFGADPLTIFGEYSYCKPTTIGECPAGFVCDYSMALGRSICCQDMRNLPIINIRVEPIINSTSKPQLTTFSSKRSKMTTRSHGWPSTTVNRRFPWYTKDRRALYRIPWDAAAHRLVPSRTTTMSITSTISTNFLREKGQQYASTESTNHSNKNMLPRPTDQHVVTTPNKTAIISPDQKYEISNETESDLFKNSLQIFQTTLTPPLTQVDRLISVSLIQVGDIKKLTDKQMYIAGAITLINDHGYQVLVDTGSASDTESLLQGLSKEMVSMDEIAMIVITSAHPNNVGNLNLFPQKPILFHTMEYTGEHATVTELVNRPYRKLTENIEIWKTPGRTQQSLSVLVHNVEEYGTIGVVGDLIPTENYIISKTNLDLNLDESVWDSLIRRQNSNLIICLADWIIPGYGHPFRVLPRYRQRAGCTRLLAQRKAAGKM